MAVTIHNTTLTAGPASANSRGLLHTTTAGSTLLVWLHTNEAVTFSSVAVAGVSPTRLGVISAGTSRAELWGMTAPGAGTLTVSAAVTGNNPATWSMVVTSYVGQRVVGGSPFGTVVAASDTAANVNLSVSSTTTDLVAFGFGISANTTLTFTNGTTRGTATHSTTGRLVVGDIAGASTVSISATAGAGTPVWGMLAVPIVASSTPVTSIAFDNAAVTGTNGAVNSFGLLLTATSNAVLLVFINSSVQSGGQTISAVNAGANALTLLGFVDYHGDVVRTQIWGLTAPPSGVLTISAVAVDGQTVALNIAAVTYTGHKTSAGGPFGGTGVVSGAATTNSGILSVSSTAGNVVVMGFGNWMFDPVSISVGSAFTVRQAPQQFPAVLIADTIGGPSITGTAQATSAVDWGSIGINLIQSDGAAARSGVAAMTDAPDVFSASGYALIRGSIVATDAPDVFSASGGARIRGSIVATDSPDTFSASGGARIRGAIIATDVADTFSASGYTLLRATIAATEAADTFSASGYVLIQGTIAATEAQDTFSASGTLVVDFSTGVFSATDAPDTFSAPGYTLIQGTFAATDAPDTFAASGTSVALFVTGTLSATDAADVFAATGQILIQGLLSATDAQDTFLATGTSDPATGSTPPAVVVTLDAGSAGHGKKKNRNLKPPYIQAPSDFWEARERYLKSLQPEMAEPEPKIAPDSTITPDISPATVSPVLLAGFVLERNEIVTALPLAKNMRELRSYGDRLRLINQRILEQKTLLLAAQAEVSALKQAIEDIRKKRANRIKRKRVLLATLEVARSLVRMYGNHPF